MQSLMRPSRGAALDGRTAAVDADGVHLGPRECSQHRRRTMARNETADRGLLLAKTSTPPFRRWSSTMYVAPEPTITESIPSDELRPPTRSSTVGVVAQPSPGGR